MKILTVILSVYTLMLSTTVCCDRYALDVCGQTIEQVAGDFSHDDCAGLCSPFCLCATCASCAIEPLCNDFQIKHSDIIDKNLPDYTQNYAQPLLKGIWQPPQKSKT